MKSKIPKGWRKLRKGTTILDTDKVNVLHGKWCFTFVPGYEVGWHPDNIYIRRKGKR